VTRPPLPAAFVQRIRRQLGDQEAAALVAALAAPPDQGLRANPRHGEAHDLVRCRSWEATPLPWCAEGVVLAPVGGERHPAGRHAWHEGGAYYLQDPAAMGVVPLLDPRPGDHVLDLAAAPGGKATHIAGRLGDEGLLWAHDATPRRADALVANLERWGATVAVTSQGDAAALGPLAGRFDRVLLDAPCSGEGMFRKSDAARERWSPQRVNACALLQLDLLDLAADLLRPGGVLVYATCTFAPEEDEATIEALLRRRPDLGLEDLAALGLRPPMPAGAVGPVERASARWWPHRGSGDGHFAARLRRDDAAIVGALDRAAPRRRGAAHGRVPSAAHGKVPSAATAAERGAWSAFATDVLGGDPLPGHDLVRFGDGRLAALPPALAAFDAPVRTAGVTLGRLIGERAGRSRFEPHHALSRVLPAGGAAAAGIDLVADDPRVHAYLRGEPLVAAGVEGWGLVRAEGVALGWVKGSRGELNNRYPRGLRRDLDRNPAADEDPLG
jgi:16S rRNA C967 or C1407 C5-methylase (RsmB/RsmF family)/NOL1/NOP2/fmu family ribosome biogenesis protein